MRSIGLLLKTILAVFCFTLLQGCGKGDVVSERKMVDMLVDMFIADQSLDLKPDLLVQKDTMMVYPPIMLKHGVTVEQFEASMRYYVEDGDSYLNILREVKEILYAKEKEVSRILKKEVAEREARILSQWWALDSIQCTPAHELRYNSYLRAIRWLVMGERKLTEWRFADSPDTDIPQNSSWWLNNMVPQNRKFVDIFLKDVNKELPSSLTTETVETTKKTDKKDEKTGRKLLDNSRRKRPGVKEGVRAIELRK